MLDRFVVGHVSRISPEAPVPVVQFQSEHVRLGGAANVAHNIVSLGGRVSLVGVVGARRRRRRLRERSGGRTPVRPASTTKAESDDGESARSSRSATSRWRGSITSTTSTSGPACNVR